MRAVPLSVLQGGIDRLRVKGGAAATRLYDLQNAYITNAGTVVPREGTLRHATLDSSTVGLAAANGTLNIFSSAFSTAALPAGYVLNVLSNPTSASSHPTKIYYAKPFMGFLYVVASFSDASVHHYWLQNNGTWAATTDYTSASIVFPPVANGFAYQGVRKFLSQPLWTPNTQITSGHYVEPNVPTGFAYQAVAIVGTPGNTGAIEPVWPTVAGGIIQDYGDYIISTSNAAQTQFNITGAFSTAASLGTTITNKYGQSATIANAGVFATSPTGAPLTLSATKANPWQPGTLYAPGAVVIPTSQQGAFINAIPNGDFELGAFGGLSTQSGWVFSTTAGGNANWYITSAGGQSQGVWCGAILPTAGAGTGASGSFMTMTTDIAVTPGQQVIATGSLNPNNGLNCGLWLQLNWYNTAGTLQGTSGSQAANQVTGTGYKSSTVTGTAPATATFVRLSVGASSNPSALSTAYADELYWNLETPISLTNFLFTAIQTAPGASGSSEPNWPTTVNSTVVDNAVTWQAVGTSIITWQAIPLMQSGLNAPTFPTTVGGYVYDSSSYTNTNGYIVTLSGMGWTCIDRHVIDTNCPNSIAVAAGASHIFAGNNDICNYSAAVNPIDWTSTNNAGYLPTGLNNYGDNPIAVISLYRSNLVVFNASGYQMWQIDADPANNALLDAQPVGSIWPRAAQSVANDLLFLTEIGVRNLGTVGPTANMAIGNTGQPVDPLVLAQINAATYDPFSIYYPGRGQYWLIYGPQAFVLTINGQNQKTWSRYIFPQALTDATLNAGNLYLRTTGNLVWQVNASATVGVDDNNTLITASPVAFNGVIQWPYLDAGALGVHKMMVGVDLVGEGSCSIQLAFDQQDKTTFNDNAGFSLSTGVTAPYTVTVDDTVPGQPLPIPILAASYSLILTFTGSTSSPNAWSWEAANLYLTPAGGGGALG